MMSPIQIAPSLTEQVYNAILDQICSGALPAGAHLVQEKLAAQLGVSRQPVQQALLLLRTQGLLRDAPGRGLMVAPLDLDHVRNLYEIRAAVDGLASAKAAERGRGAARAEGPAFIDRGRAAVASRSIARMIAADMDFHFFLYRLAENPLVAEVSTPHWSYLRRVMGEVLLHGETPADIWEQHERILEAVIAGDAALAEQLARSHASHAAGALARTIPHPAGANEDPTRRRIRRKS